MPMIQLTAVEGSLTPQGRSSIQRQLATILLRWEGAPDNAFFRSISWSQLNEVPVGALVSAEDDEPRFRVDVTVPAGALSDRRKSGLVDEVTKAVLEAAALTPEDGMRVWVLVHEQADGTWGVAGTILRYADIAATAAAQRVDA